MCFRKDSQFFSKWFDKANCKTLFPVRCHNQKLLKLKEEASPIRTMCFKGTIKIHKSLLYFYC